MVLNLADGAVGYLETEEENLKIFDVISKALKPGGKHFMDICNAEFAELYFPMRGWDAGRNALSLSEFEWDPAKRTMLFGGTELPYGEPAKLPVIEEGDPIRLYSLTELQNILAQRGMKIETDFLRFLRKTCQKQPFTTHGLFDKMQVLNVYTLQIFSSLQWNRGMTAPVLSMYAKIFNFQKCQLFLPLFSLISV